MSFFIGLAMGILAILATNGHLGCVYEVFYPKKGDSPSTLFLRGYSFIATIGATFWLLLR